MKIFTCQVCGNAVHFENTICVKCKSRLGFATDQMELSVVESDGDRWKTLSDRSRSYVFCANAAAGACNWLVAADEGETFCHSCRHDRTLPDLSIAENETAWRRIELAKRRLFYSLLRWRLPMPTRVHEPSTGLAFDLLADYTTANGVNPVLTGHEDGLITLNIAEANDATREARRMAMGEPYRTLLGHFRHEIGHYYWERLVRDGGQIDQYRAIFGDESEDYAQALRRYYQSGAPSDWNLHFISAYAASHPWEDFAETWAHYMHMVDGLETSRAFGLVIGVTLPDQPNSRLGGAFDPYCAGDMDDLVAAWVPVTIALNGLNRSLGQPDLYPFVLSQAVIEKLDFIHSLVRETRSSQYSVAGFINLRSGAPGTSLQGQR
ncbi:MAG: putative zinc-binding metallopeptidase [Rhodoblastus sp.]|uniref:zinc-binding metallopeptidase family protein n=1 Tax=Rhodoblastus sp. TaxID=1962975 RepID=UPI003F9D877E